MIENVSKEISDYLIFGMHHTTSESQDMIRKIILKNLNNEFSKMTPSEIAIAFNKIKTENNYEI